MDIDDLKMHQVKIRSWVLLASKFVDQTKYLVYKNLDKYATIHKCWTPSGKHNYLKKTFTLSAIGLTHSCEEMFYHMKAMLTTQENRPTPEHCKYCVRLKAIKYIADFEKFAETILGKGSHYNKNLF